MKYISILDFGAVANQGKLQTSAIQAAIDRADAENGVVYIPAGEFITGTLNLKNASLYLEIGAVLKGSGNIEDYVFNGYMHNEMGKTTSLIYTFGGRNIRIFGEGTIDLNGSAFFDFNSPTIPKSRVPFTERQIQECTVKYGARPNQPMFFHRVSDVKIQGITILDAPCWTMSFIESKNIDIDGITVIGHERVPNNDGMHFCSCKGVTVTNCNISTADDCIALSAITDWNIPCEDVVIASCRLKSYSKAIVIGYMHSIVRNVVISNCVIKESNRAFCIMASSRSGLVENVTVSNMILDTRVRAGAWWGNGEPIAIMATYHHNYVDAIPDRGLDVSVRNIYFSSIVCTSENAIGIVGENKNIDNVNFTDVVVNLKPSDNISLKGRVVDLAPSRQIDTIPQDGNEYFMHIQDAGEIYMQNVKGTGVKGMPAKVSRIIK